MSKLLILALAFFSAQAFAAGDSDSGKLKSQACAACHGPDGNSPTSPDFPRLAGQHYDYLLKSLRDYKAAQRPGYDATMDEVIRPITDADIVDLSHYLARVR